MSDQVQPFRVHFVCTGNICRSPIAEGLLRAWLERDHVTGVEVFSSGTYAKDGAPASRLGVAECAKYGFDTSGHRAQLLHRDLIHRSDLLLCMEADHVYEVLRMVPAAEGKVNLLGAYNVSPEDAVDMTVFDPIGGNEDDYRRCYEIIEGHLERAYPAIRETIDAARRRATDEGDDV